MADATFKILECRWLVKPDWTELYIRTGPASDGMLGVGGWYKKIIPPSVPALDAIRDALISSEYLVKWDRGNPDDAQPPRWDGGVLSHKKEAQ